MSVEDGPGWYLYGVVAAGSAVDDGDVSLVSEGPVAGVASRVSLEEFDPSALPERLGDAAWLEQKIRDHEQVLEDVLHSASVVPCRFCTVYRTEDELRRFLSERGRDLSAALARVEGRVEFGVKAFVDREGFANGEAERNDALRELSERLSQSEGGRAYLEARRLEQLITQELARFKEEVAGPLHERLAAAADDAVRLSLQRPEVTGREEEMLLNGAYLVSDQPGFEAQLHAVGTMHRKSGVLLELTGPWPPYNFVPAQLGAA